MTTPAHRLLALAVVLACGCAPPPDTRPASASAPRTDVNDTDHPPTPSSDRRGTIGGRLAYPSDYVPSMRVCALELAGGTPHCVTTVKGERRYQLSLPPGDYRVLAWPQETGAPGESAPPGGYTGCAHDLSVDCTAHDLTPVHVAPGATLDGIDPADFYAQPNDWPPEPTP